MIRCSQSSFTILSLNDWGLKVVEAEIWHDVTGVPKKVLLRFDSYTRKNAQVVTSLQTSCNKSVHKLSTSCVRTACS